MDLGWFDSSRSTDELSPPVCSRSELPWGHQETGPGQTHGQAAFSSRNASKNVFFGYRLGSLEVELPTIWTDGKAEVGRVHVYYICIYIYNYIHICCISVVHMLYHVIPSALLFQSISMGQRMNQWIFGQVNSYRGPSNLRLPKPRFCSRNPVLHPVQLCNGWPFCCSVFQKPSGNPLENKLVAVSVS